jgi:hypothetical protein
MGISYKFPYKESLYSKIPAMSAKKLIWLLIVKSSHSKFLYPTVINERWYADISLQPGRENNEPLFHRGLVITMYLFHKYSNIRYISHLAHLGRGLGQSRAKASRHWQLWPGLVILKAWAVESQAKAMAFRPSRAGTSLIIPIWHYF